ncbi:hypothetical protein [Frigoribacterium sp. UYMn621]|uniref:hypothetical protein n=1 Tax=Frigoribacterium sp. UYMn621 TaxID=3156343 RepID=UPI0033936459
MLNRSTLAPSNVPIRLPGGKPGFGIRWKLRVPRESPSTPSAGPVAGLEPLEREKVQGLVSKSSLAELLKIHRSREGSTSLREREAGDVAAEEAIDRGSLGPAVSKLLADDDSGMLTVHDAILQAILEEAPEEPREWAPTAPKEWRRRY